MNTSTISKGQIWVELNGNNDLTDNIWEVTGVGKSRVQLKKVDSNEKTQHSISFHNRWFTPKVS